MALPEKETVDPSNAVLRDPASVTPRAVLVGLAVTCLVNLLPAYSAYIVHSSRMVFAHLPMAAMVVFTAVAWPLNAVVGQVNRQWALRRGEMVVVFCMAWQGGFAAACRSRGCGAPAPHHLVFSGLSPRRARSSPRGRRTRRRASPARDLPILAPPLRAYAPPRVLATPQLSPSDVQSRWRVCRPYLYVLGAP